MGREIDTWNAEVTANQTFLKHGRIPKWKQELEEPATCIRWTSWERCGNAQGSGDGPWSYLLHLLPLPSSLVLGSFPTEKFKDSGESPLPTARAHNESIHLLFPTGVGTRRVQPTCAPRRGLDPWVPHPCTCWGPHHTPAPAGPAKTLTTPNPRRGQLRACPWCPSVGIFLSREVSSACGPSSATPPGVRAPQACAESPPCPQPLSIRALLL